jgi:hypothetical protein
MANEVEMIMNGQRVKVSESVLKSRNMQVKKVEVEINGKKLRVPEHMIKDMLRFGATITKKTAKIPPELLNFPAPKKILPSPEIIKSDEFPSEGVSTVKDIIPEVKKERKKPVRSKSKK